MRSESFFAQLRVALARPETGSVPGPAPVASHSLVHQVQVALARQSPAFRDTEEIRAERRGPVGWSGTELGRANFEGADLTSARFLRADLRGANLTQAVMQSADLRMADLRGANLTGADLTGADLQRADLRGANFEFAILVSANMRGASIGGINLRGAVMTSVDMKDVVAVPGASEDPGFAIPTQGLRADHPDLREAEPESRVTDQESGSPSSK